MNELVLNEFQYWISRIKALTYAGSWLGMATLHQAVGERLSPEQRTTCDGQTIDVVKIYQSLATKLKNSPYVSHQRSRSGNGLIWVGNQETSPGSVPRNVAKSSAAASDSDRFAANMGAHSNAPFCAQVFTRHFFRHFVTSL
jgi:hypothetical protein